MALKLIDGKPYARFNVLVVEGDQMPIVGDIQPEATTRITYNGKKGLFVGDTEAFANHVRPKWYEEFTIYLDDLEAPIKFYVKDGPRDRKIGHTSLDPMSLKPGERYDEWLTLDQPSNRKSGSGAAYAAVATSAPPRLHLVFSLTPLSILPGGFEKLSGKEAPFRMVLKSGDVVRSGDFIEGDIIFMTPRPYPLEKTFIRIYGTERVEWNEQDEFNVAEKYSAMSTVVNKWYHGWKNDSGKEINAGYYDWHFRVRVPEALPPAFHDPMGEIVYLLHAYLDHDRYTKGIPLRIRQPIPKSINPECHVAKHNVDVHGILDQPVYYLEDNPLHLKLDLTIKDLSEYNVRHVKVAVVETSTYAADTNVAVVKRVLHKSTAAKGTFSLLHYEDNGAVAPHKIFKKVILIDLPADYHKPSLNKGMGAQRIHVEHRVQVKVVKDTLTTHRVLLDIPFILTTKETKLEEKRQVISLVSATNVVTPPTPVQKRRGKGSKNRPAPVDDDDHPYSFRPPALKPFASDPDLFNSPPANPASQDISMQPFTNVFNPFLESAPILSPAPFTGPVPTWNPFPEASPSAPSASASTSSAIVTSPTAPAASSTNFDSIPSTFSSTKSISLYNADPNKAANPFVSGSFQNPFTSSNTFDVSKSSNASPNDFGSQNASDAKLPPSKNKGYDVI